MRLSFFKHNTMENIYQESIERVRNGSRFKIDFAKEDFLLDGKYVIREGIFDGHLGIDYNDNPLESIERLYYTYRYSIPTERSESKQFIYFQAVPEEDLTDEDMLYGESRDVAQLQMELCVLMYKMNNSLVWDKFAKGKWFWQSKEYPQLILIKSWFE